jgi:hypothetical protein
VVFNVARKPMSLDAERDFTCPRCQARYKVIRVKSETVAAYRMLECTVCLQELPPTEGDDILKYFLVERPRAEKRRPAS